VAGTVANIDATAIALCATLAMAVRPHPACVPTARRLIVAGNSPTDPEGSEQLRAELCQAGEKQPPDSVGGRKFMGRIACKLPHRNVIHNGNPSSTGSTAAGDRGAAGGRRVSARGSRTAAKSTQWQYGHSRLNGKKEAAGDGGEGGVADQDDAAAGQPAVGLQSDLAGADQGAG
jgi:hypothetical protein